MKLSNILKLVVIFGLTFAAKQEMNNSITGVVISEPRLLCWKAEKGLETVALVLSWSCTSHCFSFTIEMRNSSASGWKFLAVTRENFLKTCHLPLASHYQFRVLPDTPTILPVTSKWIKVEGAPSSLSAPSGVAVSHFSLQNGHVKGVVQWNASKELPCQYEVFWFPSLRSVRSAGSLKSNNLSAEMSGLLFDTNYTVRVTPLDEEIAGKSESSEAWFLTPTCLNLTGHDFNICAPSEPLNLTAKLNSTGVSLRWLPPKHASPENNSVFGYRIFVVEEGSKYVDFKAADNHTLSISFPALNDSLDYVFEVRAFSKGGIGSAAFATIIVKENKGNFLLTMLVASLAICGAVAVIKILSERQREKSKGCASGVADVPPSMLPLLVPADRVRLTSLLGQGAFGVVHKGTYSRNKADQEVVAVKVLPCDSRSRLQLLQEVEMMNIVGRHQKVVGLLGFSLDIQGAYLILEYCPMGDLRSYLLRKKPELLRMKSLPSITPTERSKLSTKKLHLGKRLCLYISQVAEGMEHISRLKLIHRDLAARNILMLDKDRVKIADFGLSRDIYETSLYLGSGEEGGRRLPIKWMAPEAIERHKFSPHSDVWSFGVLMWEVFRFGKEPYASLPNAKVLEFVKSGYRLEWPHCRPEWYDLMLECWRDEPRSRPLFREIVRRVAGIIDTMYHYAVFF